MRQVRQACRWNCSGQDTLDKICARHTFIGVKNMSLNVENYINKPRDTKSERALAQQLRQMPEEERFAFIQELLRHQSTVGLLLAASCLRKPVYFQQILELGLQCGDASTILPWLECAVPKLGFHKVILALNSRLDTDPISVDNALYWMPRFKPQNDPRADFVLEGVRTRRQSSAVNRILAASAGQSDDGK